jgi:hypothetical protein
VALQSRRAIRDLAQRAERSGGVAPLTRTVEPLHSGTTRKAVYNIARHPGTASRHWWRRFWHVPPRVGRA